jgi:hypothetical protein
MIQGIWWDMKLTGFAQDNDSGEPFLTQQPTISI